MDAKQQQSQASDSAQKQSYLVTTYQKVEVPALPEEFTIEYFQEQEALRAALILEREKAEYKMREMILTIADKLGCIDDATEFLCYDGITYVEVAAYYNALKAVYYSTSKQAA